MSPIRTDVSLLDLFSGAGLRLDAPAAAGRPQAFSDFSAFTEGDTSARLGAPAASIVPAHAARAVVAFIAEG